jgi:hypothetical protein
MTYSFTYLKVTIFFILWGKGKGEGKGKARPVQAWTGPEGSSRLGLPDF